MSEMRRRCELPSNLIIPREDAIERDELCSNPTPQPRTVIPDPIDKPAPLHREESTTPDLVELTRTFFETMDREWDVDAIDKTRAAAERLAEERG